MVSRRLLRIKTLQICYAYLKSSEQSINQAEKGLFFSIQKSYDLYHYLILLILDVVNFAESRIELAKQKKIPAQEDLNPNTKFIDNKLIKLLNENYELKKYLTRSIEGTNINEKRLFLFIFPRKILMDVLFSTINLCFQFLLLSLSM